MDVPFLVFLTLYGFLNRFMYYYTDGFPYSFLFITPFFIMLFFADQVWDTLLSMGILRRILVLVYFIMILYSSFAFSLNDLISSGVAFTAYFVPVMFVMLRGVYTDDVEKTIKITFPFIIALFIFQFADKYFYFDRYYLSKVSSYIFTSLKLGSHYRPFSTFSSAEELSAFLSFTSVLGLFSKSRYLKVVSVISFAALILLSSRTGLALTAFTVIYWLLANKKFKYVISFAVVIVLIGISANLFFKETAVKKEDSRLESVVKHTLEPFKSGFGTYSLKKRIESLQKISEDIKRHPFGKGLTHAESVLSNNKQEYPIESSALKIAVGGGYPMIGFLIIVYLASLTAMLKMRNSTESYFILYAMLAVVFMNGLTMHFIPAIIAMSFVKSAKNQ